MFASLTAVPAPASTLTWRPGPRPVVAADDTRTLAPGVTVSWSSTADRLLAPASLGGADWQLAARCRNAGHAIFFDDEGAGPQLRPTVLARAQAFCRGCPVTRECLSTALERGDRYGVWAGASGRQREKMRLRIVAGEPTGAVVAQWLASLA